MDLSGWRVALLYDGHIDSSGKAFDIYTATVDEGIYVVGIISGSRLLSLRLAVLKG